VGNVPTIEGYIIKYNTLSRPIALPNGRNVYERILPGSFAESVASGAMVKANVEHQQNNALTKLGDTSTNIKLEHRPDGVFATVALLDDTLSQDVFKRVAGKLVNGASIEFKPYAGVEPTYSTLPNGDYLRTWNGRLNLSGFAVVDEGMYADAQIFARSIDAAEKELIVAQIAVIESRLTYEYEAWMLGIRT
jgi:HK97 family phage prohead protease